jgi:hypothetical protein
MRIRIPMRHRLAGAALLLVGASAAGCAEDTAGERPAVVEEVPGGIVPADTPQLGTLIAADVRLDGVVLAALLLGAGGDLEAAVAAGLVTPAEVDTAAAALADGTLAAWVAEAGAPTG